MKLIDSIQRTAPAQALSSIKKTICGHLSRSKQCYIGCTTDVDRRRQQHSDGGWTRMVLLYDAWSLPIAMDMERELIEWSTTLRFRATVENLGRGGEGLPEGRQSYVVYILLR